MADFTPTIYDLTRSVSNAPNYTTNKTAATTGNNYYYQNNGRVGLVMAAGTTSNVTVETPGTVDGLAITDLVLALADTNIRVFGVFPPQIYNDSLNRVKVTVSAATDLFAIRF